MSGVSYTLLHPKDIPRYLGCEIICKEATNQLAVLGNMPMPRPLSKLASRRELFAWLSRVLIYSLVPGSSRSSTCPIQLPNNLVAFFALLHHLPSVGYPSHWLAEFVQTLLDNTFVTDASPYLGRWPIPLSDHLKRLGPMRKVPLHPWMAEIETIVAIAHQAFPFSINLPSEFATTHQDIGMFEVTVALCAPLEDVLDREPVVSLLLFKSAHQTDGVVLVDKLSQILDGQYHNVLGSFFVLTSLDLVEIPGGKIHFRLSRKKVRQMTIEGDWSLIAYRTDVRVPCKHFKTPPSFQMFINITVTYPVSASAWKDISPLTT